MRTLQDHQAMAVGIAREARTSALGFDPEAEVTHGEGFDPHAWMRGPEPEHAPERKPSPVAQALMGAPYVLSKAHLDSLGRNRPDRITLHGTEP